MTVLRGKVVAVTGAGSGIGRALAHVLVARGAEVAISDLDEGGLAETMAQLRGVPGASAPRVTSHVVDVRQRPDWDRYAASIEAHHGGVDVLINNAGVAIRGSFEEISYADFDLVINVNFWGVVHGVKAFLPLLRRRGAGHIVNVSSINGLVPFVKQSPYNASKYAVLGLSETLMQELREDPIRVTCVHPGGIRTNIARNARGASADDAAFFDKIARTPPAQAAEQIVRGIEEDRERVYVGVDAKVMSAFKRLAPSATVRFFGRLSTRWGERAKPGGRAGA